MDDLDDELVAATMNVAITEKTLHALQEAAGLTGLEGGLVVNRAIQVYADMVATKAYAMERGLVPRVKLVRPNRGRRAVVIGVQVFSVLWGAWQAALMCQASSVPAEIPHAVGAVMSIVVYVWYDVFRVRLRKG